MDCLTSLSTRQNINSETVILMFFKINILWTTIEKEVSTETERNVVENIQHTFMMMFFMNLGLEENNLKTIFNLVKYVYRKS